MKIDEETIKCISIAEKPGNFGVQFHNQAYEFMNLNFVYLPLKVESSQLESILRLVRDNFRGCSVSAPHKIRVIDYLDELDYSASKTQAVNTILNEKGKLIGYNTDLYGVKKALSSLNLKGKEIVMVGAGGFARAIGYAVKDLEGRLTIINRTAEKAESFAKELKFESAPWEERNRISGYLFINATSIGLYNPKEIAIDSQALSNFEIIMDAVIPETELQKQAQIRNITLVPSLPRTVYQAIKQFEIYTGKELPDEFIQKALKDLK